MEAVIFICILFFLLLHLSNSAFRQRTGYFCLENYDPTVKKKKRCKFGTGGFTPSTCIGLGGCFPANLLGDGGTGAYQFSADAVGTIWLDTWKSSTDCSGPPLTSIAKLQSYFCVNFTAAAYSSLLVYNTLPNYGTGTLLQTTYFGAGCNGPAISVTVTSPATLKATFPTLTKQNYNLTHCQQVACAAAPSGTVPLSTAVVSKDSICTIALPLAAASHIVNGSWFTILTIALSMCLLIFHPGL